MVFVVVGTYTKRVINEFALEQGLIILLRYRSEEISPGTL